jgi:hypothetical protein
LVHLASFTALFVSAGLLLAGNGLFGTLIAIRANLEAFSPTTIGLLGSVFYAGFIAGSILAPRLIIRAGHIALAAPVPSYAAAALIHALLAGACSGCCFARWRILLRRAHPRPRKLSHERTPNTDRARLERLSPGRPRLRHGRSARPRLRRPRGF